MHGRLGKYGIRSMALALSLALLAACDIGG